MAEMNYEITSNKKLKVLHLSNLDQYSPSKSSLEKEAKKSGINLELIENRGNSNYYKIDTKLLDAILVSTWSGINQDQQGK